MPGSKNPYQAIADAELCSEAFARQQDEKDGLSKLRNEFVIPSKGDLKNKQYGFARNAQGWGSAKSATQDSDNEESIYFCGNSLGLQPRRIPRVSTEPQFGLGMRCRTGPADELGDGGA